MYCGVDYWIIGGGLLNCCSTKQIVDRRASPLFLESKLFAVHLFSAEYLGVILDSHLQLSKYINNICKSASGY